MTREEFNNAEFGPNMTANYNGDDYPITAVNFHEGLLELDCPGCPIWVRCESVESVSVRSILQHRGFGRPAVLIA